MHILCSKWGSFDSEFYTDNDYFNMLAYLMPLSLIPTDKRLIIIEKKTTSNLIHKESEYTGLQTSKNSLYRMITDITRIPSLVSIFTLLTFEHCIGLMQYTHYRGRPQGGEAIAGRSRVVEWWVGRGAPGSIYILCEFDFLRRLLFLQKSTLTFFNLYFQLFLPKFSSNF